MTTHVYAGSSLAADDVLGIAPYAVVHPPLRAGDLLALHTDPFDTVVVLDGAFPGGRARPEEFVEVLRRGTRVIGAAAAGALHAVELWPYGMQGVGVVFGMYVEGTLEADDEVVPVRPDDPRGPRPLLLVNLRWGLAHTVRDGTVDAADAAALVELARTLPAARRTWQELVPLAHAVSEATGRAAGVLRRLAEEQSETFDLVRQDARDALLHATLPLTADVPAVIPPRLLARTVHLERRRAAVGRPAVQGCGPRAVSELDVLRFQQLYAPDFPARYRRFALARIAGTRLRTAERGLVWAALESARELGVAAGMLPSQAWAYWLTAQELRDLSTESQLLVLLVRSFRAAAQAAPWAEVPEELRGTEEMWASGAQAVAAADWLNERGDGEAGARPPVRAHLEEVWSCAGRPALTAAARDRGFVSLEEAELAARRFVRLRQVRVVQRV